MSFDARIVDLLVRWEEICEQGQPISPEELCGDCPELLEELKRRIQGLVVLAPMLSAVNRDAPHTPPEPASLTERPQQIGRYRVVSVLGEGGFGRVYLAHDDLLDRPVAVKVPHRKLVSRAKDAEPYLTEARTAASLDHPNIVPVHDVGNTGQFPCYVVAKYIDGSSLKTKAQTSRLSLEGCAELVATVADALHHAHKQGIVHRDIKPGNILLDKSGKPFVADFGLALREQDVGKGPRYAGTPAYMSPEQARGEGHRVDGRSDIFSLGVLFYELLTGRRPFEADSRHELLEQITSVEARPPRQIDDRIPKELERICLKALAKRASERYTTAKDLADDLRHFLAGASVEERSAVTGRERSEANAVTPMPSPVPTPSDQQALKIVPKGLRSFDAADADFFLELLPGPRDRDGLPESIRFWKTRIETTDAEGTFPVGLIYGPSGCGKSSLVKAGLLPRLAKSVTAVYVEATAEETEARLLKGLRRQLADLPGNLALLESLAALRRGRFLEPAQKVLLVLDQFEQWLHVRRSEEHPELVRALRQCDGGRVQCVVLVRDDFWMAATRFMENLEISLVQGQNCAAVDLFDFLHACKVLAEFGRAYGHLPDSPGKCTNDQKAFLDRAVHGLAQDDKVISVRLALFAEMVKGKPWVPATLRNVGGAEGVGVTFLEETFAASTAPPQHRLHMKAAQAVLSSLLPEVGTDIRGHMRSQKGLLEASGYGSRPREFDDLLRILDGELRLITPTDPEGVGNEGRQAPATGERFYQLTHDYLVPSLRQWLNQKQRESRHGRAELRLAYRVALWSVRKEKRQLPNWWEWASIRLLTRPREWTTPQRLMMRRATRYYLIRLSILLAALTLTAGAAFEKFSSVQARFWVGELKSAETKEVPHIINELEPYLRHATPLLKEMAAEALPGSKERLRASLALARADPGQVDYLYDQLLTAEPDDFLVIRDALLGAKLKAITERAVELLEEELSKTNVPDAPEDAKNALAKRQANAAIALFDHGQTSDLWPLLKHSSDPRLRTYLIHRLAPFQIPAQAVIDRLDAEKDVSVRRALILSLGEYDKEQVSPTVRQKLVPGLLQAFRDDPDPGIHSALDWLLNRWGHGGQLQRIDFDLVSQRAKGDRHWYVNSQRQTLSIVTDAVLCKMGAPLDESRNGEVSRKNDPYDQFNETLHDRRIGRRFAIGTKEVTFEQFGRCAEANRQYLLRVDDRQYSPTDDCPQINVTWYDAAMYCRWLSERERIPEDEMCFPPLPEIKEGMKLPANYLGRTGYRLPTEAEWECACRAGTITSRCYGHDESLLTRYACFRANADVRTSPVGRFKPNDFGLFDMHGNASEWCQTAHLHYPRPEAAVGTVFEDKEDDDLLKGTKGMDRALRGGSYGARAWEIRSAYRDVADSSNWRGPFGFRIARTVH